MKKEVNKERLQEIRRKTLSVKPLSFFEQHSDYCELNRYTSDGVFVDTLGCFDENMLTLYNSQFADKTIYGEVYLYDLYEY